MKIQKMIRVQLMLMGLGAGLLTTKPVLAQQDTDPTLFEATVDASQPDQMPFNVAPPAEAARTVQLDSTALPVVQEANAASLTALDMETVLALVVGIGSIVLLGMAEAARSRRRRIWREEASRDFPNGATAN
jgi:hypothetical protein